MKLKMNVSRSADTLRTVINRITSIQVPGNIPSLRHLRTMLWLTTIVASGCGLATARGEVIINHPYPSPPTTSNYNVGQSSFSATDSHPATGRQGSRVYDVFRLSLATFPLGADIRTVNWEMAVGDFDNHANNPPGPLLATSYRVSFWADVQTPGQRSQPGGELFSLELPAAAVQTVFKGNATDLPDDDFGKNFAYYHVSFDLPEPFHAAPNTSYWVSWMAFTPTFWPAYGSYTTVSGGQLWQDRLDRDGNRLERVDRVGYAMVYSLEGTATPPSFAGWIAGFGLTGPSAAANADPDLDGMPNSLEYVLGGNPTIPSVAGLPTATRAGGNFVFTFNRADASETPDIALAVQAGPDLVNWPTVYTIGPDSAASSPGVIVTENGTAPDTITVTIPQGAAARIFARLRVTVTP